MKIVSYILNDTNVLNNSVFVFFLVETSMLRAIHLQNFLFLLNPISITQ